MAITATIGLTVYFPFVISETGEIPKHREEATRAGIMLTFAYYGVLHLFRRNTEVYPINFLITFLFNTVVAGLYVFYRHEVPIEEYLVAIFWIICLVIFYIASRPLMKDYFT
jgi:hypothetical protein